MHPTSGLAQSLTRFARLTLKQPDLAVQRFRFRLDIFYSAPCFQFHVDSPLPGKLFRCREVGPVMPFVPFVPKKFGDIETNSSCPDDGHLVSHLCAVPEHIDVAQDFGVIDSLDAGGSR